MTSASIAFGADSVATTPLPAAPVAAAFSVGAPQIAAGLERRLDRLRRHRARLVATDAAIITAAAVATAVLQLALLPAAGISASSRFEIIAECAILVASWCAFLLPLRRRSLRRGAGLRADVVPVLHSAALAFAVLTVTTAVAGWSMPRLQVLVTLPVTVAALATARLLWSLWASHSHSAGIAPRTIVIGERRDIENAIRTLNRDGRLGHNVVGTAFVGDDGVTELTVDGTAYPVLGTPEQAAQIARAWSVDTVVAASSTSDPDFVRRLSWSLEGAASDLVLATRLTDVARARLSFDSVDGLALTHVGLPKFDRGTLRAKRMLDVAVATVALVPIALVTPIIALFISLDSRGGVIFRQRRIGRDGHEFDILKFRTMDAGAEAQRAQLEGRNEGSGPLFKLKSDPRVTRVGAILRRFSLDELPQFWNVLRGDMSVVGPRPPLPSEVRDYDGQVLRRLYVQPGITGLWQVSGRSDLSWDESVRLDLHYVENWSLATDLRIILRTAAVLVRPRGAY